MILPLLLFFGVFLIFLFTEQFLLKKRTDSIPLRIAVTGTRGKSGIVRMLAAVLREEGMKTLGKVTGSHACLLLPDGTEEEIKRRGLPTILEQKGVIRRAAALGVDALVCEIMSIHPENQLVESRKILKAHALVISNVREDHTDAMGASREEIAEVFCSAVPGGAAVYLPGGEMTESLQALVLRRKGHLISVAGGASKPILDIAPLLEKRFFPEQLDLVLTVARDLGISNETIAHGLEKGAAGGLEPSVWTYQGHFCVDGFGANDPESTFLLLKRFLELVPEAPVPLAGLLALRWDRGDRTLQWLDALKAVGPARFDPLFVTGGHAAAFSMRMKSARRLQGRSPESMMQEVMQSLSHPSVIFGFGNRKGTGSLMVDFWNEKGEPYGS